MGRFGTREEDGARASILSFGVICLVHHIEHRVDHPYVELILGEPGRYNDTLASPSAEWVGCRLWIEFGRSTRPT
jgi:hypothetical protein